LRREERKEKIQDHEDWEERRLEAMEDAKEEK